MSVVFFRHADTRSAAHETPSLKKNGISYVSKTAMHMGLDV